MEHTSSSVASRRTFKPPTLSQKLGIADQKLGIVDDDEEVETKTGYQTLGTKTRYSIRGRFMELNALLQLRKEHLFRHIFAIVLIVPVWPLAIPVLCVAGTLAYITTDRMQRIASSVAVLLFICVAEGFVIYLVPMLCIYGDWSFQLRLVSRHEIVTMLLGHAGFLILFLWAWTSESTYTEVRNIKASVLRRWRETRIAQGPFVKLCQQQHLTLQKLYRKPEGTRLPEWTNNLQQDVTLPDIVDLLHCLPGWKPLLQFGSSAEEHTASGWLIREHDEYHDEENMMGLNVLDDLVIHEKYRSTQWDLYYYTSLTQIISAKLGFCHAYICIPFKQKPVVCGLILIITTVRGFMPYIWMRMVLHEDSMTCLPLYGCFLYTALLSFWILAALSAVVIFEDNATQMCLASSLIDAQQRATYIDILGHRGVSKSESRRYMGMLPHLDCRYWSNVLIFWRIREYLLLDQKDATFSAELLVKMYLGALALILLLALLSVVSGGEIGLYDALCRLIDLSLASFVVTRLLQSSMQIIYYRDMQIASLVELRHDLMIKVSRPLALLPATQELLDNKLIEPQEINDVRELITHLIDKIERNDEKQLTWMGITLTPGNLMVLAISVGMTIFGLFEQLISLGVLGNLFERQFWSTSEHDIKQS